MCLEALLTERMIQVQLEKLGWNGFFASQACAGVPGRVASATREHFLVWTEERRSRSQRQRTGASTTVQRGRRSATGWHCGRMHRLSSRSSNAEPCCRGKHAGRAMDEQVLATNIDVLFIVSGLDDDYNERRIERYLVVARQSGARPVILLNKADLAEQYGIDLDEIVARLARLERRAGSGSQRAGRRRP